MGSVLFSVHKIGNINITWIKQKYKMCKNRPVENASTF